MSKPLCLWKKHESKPCWQFPVRSDGYRTAHGWVLYHTLTDQEATDDTILQGIDEFEATGGKSSASTVHWIGSTVSLDMPSCVLLLVYHLFSLYSIELVLSGSIFTTSNQQIEGGVVNAKLECFPSRHAISHQSNLFKLQVIISHYGMARPSVQNKVQSHHYTLQFELRVKLVLLLIYTLQ